MEVGKRIAFTVGVLVEVPRCAIMADSIAELVDFFSFGTNDLTQLMMGISRDDFTRYSKYYEDMKIFTSDPFQVIDRNGVGRLIHLASREGRRVQPDLEIGVCGQHAGDPESVDFFASIGADYVSCSPYRVPIMRLAAAQAALRNRDFVRASSNVLSVCKRSSMS